MFKSLKKKPDKVKEKLDFKLSFHATRVPLEGWDKLVISVIPIETGRAVAKTPRAVVKNGNCQWPDNIIESTRLVYDLKSKEIEEKKYKFVVSSGSSRSGVLGEVTVNLGEFASYSTPQQRALPLKNCTTGTVLHVNVTCLTARITERAVNPNSNGDGEEAVVLSDDEDQDRATKPGDGGNSGHLQSQSPRKPQLDSPPLSPVSPAVRKMQQRHVSQSALRYSNSSFDSLEIPSTPGTNSITESGRGFHGETSFSSNSFASLPDKLDRGRDFSSVDSYQSSPASSFAHKRTQSSSAASSGHFQIKHTEGSPTTNWGMYEDPYKGGGQDVNSLRVSLEAAESTIEELRMEVTTSQRQARKFGVDVQQLNHKLENALMLNKEKDMEVSALVAERAGLKHEVEQLKSERQASQDRENGQDNARWAVEDAQRIIQELRQEIMFDENTISNLNTQLQKTQESNMQLVTEIDDLERALEQHRQELDDLKATKNVIPLENLESDHLDTEEASESKTPAATVEIKDSCTAMTQTETQSPRVHSVAPVEESTDMVVKGLQNMVKQLQQDVEELEAESIRLTDENIDLQTKLESSKIEIIHKNKLVSDLKADQSSESWSPRSLPSHYNRRVEVGSESGDEGRAQLLGRVASLEGELSRLKEELAQLLDDREEDENTIHRLQVENEELEKNFRYLESGQLHKSGAAEDQEVASADTRLRIEELEGDNPTPMAIEQSKSAAEVEYLLKLLESEKLDKESIQRDAEEKARESQGCLDHALKDLELTKEHLNTLIYDLKYAEERSTELENLKRVLENQLTELKGENVKLSDRVTLLELELKFMTEERDSHEDERVRLQGVLDSTTEQHQDLAKQLTHDLGERTKEYEDLKNSHHALDLEVVQLRREIEESRQDLEQRTKDFENTRNVLEESFHDVSRDHGTAVATSAALQAQVAQLQSDLEDMEMRSTTASRTLSMLKESEQMRAERTEEALQQNAALLKDKDALEKCIAELQLVLEHERKLHQGKNGRDVTNGNGNSYSESEQGIHEGQAKLHDQEAQQPVQFEMEVNEKLASKLHGYKAAVTGGNMVDRVVYLEMELSEALDANDMYKLQLRSALSEQQNVHAVALQNFGDVDQIVSDLVGLRTRVKQLEGELRDMRERYSAMSLRFAEVEVEREELVMTIRTLRNGRKL